MKAMRNKLQAIFFDFDGVILESVDIKGWAFGKLFEEYPDKVQDIVAFHHANGGMSRFDKFRHIYDSILGLPLSQEHFRCLCDEFSRLVYERVLACPFVPGALEFLKEHHKKIPLYIVSGTPDVEIKKIVNARGLAGYFHGVYGSPTPKGSWVKIILDEASYDPRKTVFVGDAMSDYEAARENAVFFIARVTDPEKNIFPSREGFSVILSLAGLEGVISSKS